MKLCTVVTPYPGQQRQEDKRKEVSLLNPQEFFDEIILQTEMSLLLLVQCLAPV